MIEQGTDGLSRGNLNSRVMRGKDFLSLIPLDKGALDLSPGLALWMSETFLVRCHWEVLNPDNWLCKGHSDGHFIWAPPPAVADVALEQMCEAFLS